MYIYIYIYYIYIYITSPSHSVLSTPMVAKHLSQHALQRIHLNRISQGRSGAVALDEPHVLGLHGALLQPGCSWFQPWKMTPGVTTESL